MAKKNTSVNLEEDILDYIDKYREENALSSRNKALERIILKFQTQEKEIEDLKYFECLVKNGEISVSQTRSSNNAIENKTESISSPRSKKGQIFKDALGELEEGDE